MMVLKNKQTQSHKETLLDTVPPSLAIAARVINVYSIIPNDARFLYGSRASCT